MNSKTIAIIPARGGSKRLPNKNILPLGRIPLLAHSILFAQKHDFISDVYVSTDDEKIKKIALEYGAKVVDRPLDISGDLEPTITALQHVIHSIEENVENAVLLQSTNPLRPDNLLKEAFEIFLNKDCDSLFTVTPNRQKLGKIQNDRFQPFNYKIGQRSQDLEPMYFENGLLYICKVSAILKGEIITENAFPLVVNHVYTTVDIDTQEDFDLAEYLYNKF